jgi:PatG Domain
MKQTIEASIDQPGNAGDVPAVVPSQEPNPGAANLPPQPNAAPCPTCVGPAASLPASHVYAIGRIEARFPRLSVEKEFAQATGRAETAGQTDQQAF